MTSSSSSFAQMPFLSSQRLKWADESQLNSAVDPRKAVGCQALGEQIYMRRQRTLP
jgi:hypothetical protein